MLSPLRLAAFITCLLGQGLAYWQFQRMQTAWNYYQASQHVQRLPHPPTTITTPTTRWELQQKFNTKQYALIKQDTQTHLLALSQHRTHYYVTDLGPIPKNSSIKDHLQKHSTYQLRLLPYYPSIDRSLNQEQEKWPIHLPYRQLRPIQQKLTHPLFEYILLSEASPLYQRLSSAQHAPAQIARHLSYTIQFSLFGWLACLYCHLLTRKTNEQDTK